MPPKSSSPLEEQVVRLYRVGLRLYPRSHRDRFGPELEGLFRLLWREVHATRSTPALVRFALTTLIDLLAAASRERLANLRPLMLMHPKTNPASRVLWSLGAGAAAFLLAISVTCGIAWAWPKTYQSGAKILMRYVVQENQNPVGPIDPVGFPEIEMERMLTDEVLEPVARNLGLAPHPNPALADDPRTREETLRAIQDLRQKVTIHRFRQTTVFEVRVRDRNRFVAAETANAMVDQFIALRSEARPHSVVLPPVKASFQILERAKPGSNSPVSPNLPLFLAVGIVGGGGFALLTTLLVWLYLKRSPRLALS